MAAATPRHLWSVSALAEEFGTDRRTMAKRLEDIPAAAELEKGRPGWRLMDVILGIYGGTGSERINIEVEKARSAKGLADKLELENARTRRELLPADEVARADEAIFGAIRDALLALPDGLADVLCEVAVSEGPAGVALLLRDRIEALLEDAASAEIEIEEEAA